MAKHRKRRSHSGYSTLNVAGMPLAGKQVAMTDVYLGAVVGTLGMAALNKLHSATADASGKSFLDPLWDSTSMASSLRPLVGTGLAAAVSFFAFKKSKPAKAAGLATGAIAAGIFETVRAVVTSKLVDDKGAPYLNMSGLTDLQLPSGGYNGVIMANPGGNLAGVIMNNPGPFSNNGVDQPALDGLSAMAMVEDDDIP